MDWTNALVNGGVVAGAASVVGFAVRRWTSHVDRKLGEVVNRLHELEVALAGKYVRRGNHKDLEQEFREFENDVRDRLAVMETTVGLEATHRKEAGR